MGIILNRIKNSEALGIEIRSLKNKGNKKNKDKKARYSEIKLDQGGQQDGLKIDRIKNIMLKEDESI